MMRYAILSALLFLLTGCVVGTSPSGIPKIGVKDYYDWDAFVAGDRKVLLIAFTRFSSYQAGIAPIASYEGSRLPASLELALDANKIFSGRTASMNEAYVIFKSGDRLDLISPGSSKRARFTAQNRDGHSFSRVVFEFPNSINKRKDYTVYAKGTIEGVNGRVHFQEKAGVIYNSNFGILPAWMVLLAD